MKTLSLLLVLCFPLIALSQEAPIQWKEIPIEDLKMTSYEPDPYATAVVLCDYEQIYFDTKRYDQNLMVYYDRHVRIKILKPEGLKYARISIPYQNMIYERLTHENNISIRAMVYNLNEKGKIVAERLKNNEIKYRDSTYNIKLAEFTIPDVKPGSVIEYYYQKPSLDLIQPESWYFQHDIPTRYSELRLKVPEGLNYQLSTQNFTDFDIKEETSFSSTINFSKRAYGNLFYEFYNDYSGLVKETALITGNQIRMVKKNIEAFTAREFISKPKDYMQKINLHLDKLFIDEWDYLWYPLKLTTLNSYDSYTPFQRNNLVPYYGYLYYETIDWSKINSQLIESDRFGLPLSGSWENEPPLNIIIENKYSQLEKMVAIYDYLRKNIKWTGKYNTKVKSVSCQITNFKTNEEFENIQGRSLSESFNQKKGSSSEINFMLIYLLNKAGIETYPVIISTRNNGKIDNDIPESKQFNQVLAYAKIGNEQFLLDATDSLRPYKMLDVNDLNSTGFQVKRNGFAWVPIENKGITETNISEKIQINNNLGYSSQLIISETGYDALNHRKTIAKDGKEKFINDYKSQKLNSEFNNHIEINNIENDSLPIIIAVNQSESSKNENEFNFLPNFETVYNKEQFTEMNRKNPVDFVFPFRKEYELELTVPENYIVELPVNESFSTFENNARFEYSARSIGNKTELQIRLQILKSEFPASEYNNLKELFTKLNKKLKESIVVRKTAIINNP